MAVTNLYSNLPGHLVEFKDGGLQLTSTTVDTSSSKSLLILGTATDGPINEPVRIDATTVSQVFGKEVDANGYPNGTTLTKYAKQAFKNGFDDVRCMRVTGSQAYTTIYGQQTVDYERKYKTINGSEDVDGNGVVKGNEAFAYSFTVDAPAADKTLLVRTPKESDKLIVKGMDGNDVTYSLASPVSNTITYDSYDGISISANLFATLSQVTFNGTGIRFIGDDAEGDLVTSSTISLAVVEDTTEDSPVLRAVSTGVNDTVKTKDDGNGGSVVVDIFKDLGAASETTANIPNLTAMEYKNGFKVTKQGASSPLDPADYDITVANDGTVTITFSNGVVDGDTVNVLYYPYEEYDVTLDLTETFNNKIAASTIDVSSMNDFENAEITSITVGNTTFGTAQLEDIIASNENGTLTINIVGTMKPNDVISVMFGYDEPINSNLELKVKSQWGGSLYKAGKVEVKKQIDGNNQYTIIEFTHAKTGKKYSYSSQFYHSVDDLILAMKNDANNLNMFEIEIVKGDGTDLIDMLTAIPETALSEGGDDGIKPTNNEMFKALSGDRYTESDIGNPISEFTSEVVTQDMVGYLKTQGAYQILENYNVDYIYPAGVYADSVQTVDANSDFQRELALVCAVLTYRTKMTHGFIDVKPNSNTTLVGIDAYVTKLLNSHPNVYYMTDSNGEVIYDSDNKPMDIGWYTSVVVGPEPVMVSDTLGQYYGSPAIAYAGLNAVLAPQSSPMNKGLRNVNGMKFKFSNKQMDAIIGQRMVCFKLKNEGLAVASSTPYVVDGVTSGARGCDYSDIAIVKTITDVVDQIRDVADPFIGEQNTVEQRNALSALISKRLGKLVELGEIQAYEFEVSATIQQQLLGEASIALTIVPAMTLRKITTVVALRAAQ